VELKEGGRWTRNDDAFDFPIVSHDVFDLESTHPVRDTTTPGPHRQRWTGFFYLTTLLTEFPEGLARLKCTIFQIIAPKISIIPFWHILSL
jgi:hypothetical protein